jgi:hypothetical protein
LTQFSSRIRKQLFGIDRSEVEFARRGFIVRSPAAVTQLERVAGFFVEGYMAGLDDPEPESLGHTLDRIEPEYRGFAFEGAGMALALLDFLTPWRRDRLAAFLAGPGDPHAYMVHVGAGWAWARLRSSGRSQLRALDPLLGWLALDGYGFHEAFFHPRKTVEQRIRPARLEGYALRAFDMGLGRCLWFVCCADPDVLADSIGRFEPARQADLWAGSGLACSYAGGAPQTAIERVVGHAGRHRGALAQGAAFAAKARQRAGIPTDHTRGAVARICAVSADIAAKVCDEELAGLPPGAPRDGEQPGFDIWRSRIRESFERGFAGGEIAL